MATFFILVQLVLEAQNVPELSAGVNCTFEDLTEMSGLVEGNRIKCSSPAEKEMPRIIVDKGKGPTSCWPYLDLHPCRYSNLFTFFFPMATLVALAKKQRGCAYKRRKSANNLKRANALSLQHLLNTNPCIFQEMHIWTFPLTQESCIPTATSIQWFFFPFLSASRWPWSTARGHA